jgi:hypothetical protein
MLCTGYKFTNENKFSCSWFLVAKLPMKRQEGFVVIKMLYKSVRYTRRQQGIESRG